MAVALEALPYNQAVAANTENWQWASVKVCRSVQCSATCEWWWRRHAAVAKEANKGGVSASDGNSCIANLYHWRSNLVL